MYIFDFDDLKARDLPGISKAMDICISRLIFPFDMKEWKEGDNKLKIEKRVHMTNMSDTDAHCARSEPDAEGMVVLEYAFNEVAMRYIFFLMKKKVEELTGIPATTNSDVDWDFHYPPAKKEE